MTADSVSTAVLPYGATDTRYEKVKSRESSWRDQTNPAAMVCIFLINAYQKIFSSLDGSTCQFRPSCSHFGATAIKRYGPVQGILMTSDRLLRCNQFARGKYPRAPDNLHLADPVEDHSF